MTHDIHDEDDLLRRFLVGEATEGERQSIEDEMFRDAGRFEAVAALEHEMLVDLVRGTLAPRWAGPFAAAISQTPDRQRHLDEVRRMIAALPAPGRHAASIPAVAAKAPGISWRPWAAAAAVVMAATAGLAWQMRAREEVPPTTVPDSPARAEFVLSPGPTRAPSAPANVIDLSKSSDNVRLIAVLDIAGQPAISARLRPVGGDFLPLPKTTSTRRVIDGLEVAWDLAAAAVPAGDYLVEYATDADPSVRQTVGGRFVRIVR